MENYSMINWQYPVEGFLSTDSCLITFIERRGARMMFWNPERKRAGTVIGGFAYLVAVRLST
jgi:hypothetical protein